MGLLFTDEVAEVARSDLRPCEISLLPSSSCSSVFNTNPADIPPVLPVALALAVVGIKPTRHRLDRGERESTWQVRAGSLLAARGEFSVLIAGIVTTSPFAPDVVPLATTYVLIIADAGPILAKVAEPWSNFPSDVAPGLAAASDQTSASTLRPMTSRWTWLVPPRFAAPLIRGK